MTSPYRSYKPDMADDTNNICGNSTQTECAKMGGGSTVLIKFAKQIV